MDMDGYGKFRIVSNKVERVKHVGHFSKHEIS